MSEAAILRLTGVGKRFAGVPVLQDVSLELRAGEILALCGANGAGKSTLIKVVTGAFDNYEGEVEVGGRPVRLTNPAVARAAGIDAVYQEVDTCIAPDLTVAENLLLYRLADPASRLWVARRRLMAEAAEVAKSVRLGVDLGAEARSLSLQRKQLLVIARAVAQDAKVLIFDEPTASLSLPEIELLFATIRELSARGLGIVYVSHRLAEVQALCDRVVVLRNGRLVQRFDTMPETGPIATAMLGAAPDEEFPAAPAGRAQGEIVFEAREIRAGIRVRGVSLAVARGEILGVTGLVGAGKTELLRCLFGADPRQAGELRVGGRALSLRRPQDAVRHGIYLVPEERRRQGLFLDFPAYQNLTSAFLGRFCRLGVVQGGVERRAAAQMAEQMEIQGDVDGPVLRLSGGNQQKVVIGKWLLGRPTVLLLDEATQGVDIGTRRQIYRLVRQISKQSAVVFASSDIDEVMGVADRFLVMFDGRVVGEFVRGEVDRQRVLELASGARRGMVV